MRIRGQGRTIWASWKPGARPGACRVTGCLKCWLVAAVLSLARFGRAAFHETRKISTVHRVEYREYVEQEIQIVASADRRGEAVGVGELSQTFQPSRSMKDPADAWQREFRMFWPLTDQAERWVELPPGVAEEWPLLSSPKLRRSDDMTG